MKCHNISNASLIKKHPGVETNLEVLLKFKLTTITFNPIPVFFRWKMNDAETIIEGALNAHYKMINEFKGVPGVLPEKLAEGMKVREM